jgi:hypothetical protein
LQVEKNFLNGKLKAITAYFEEQDSVDVERWWSDESTQKSHLKTQVFCWMEDSVWVFDPYAWEAERAARVNVYVFL